jgi:hypothetical protein
MLDFESNQALVESGSRVFSDLDAVIVQFSYAVVVSLVMQLKASMLYCKYWYSLLIALYICYPASSCCPSHIVWQRGHNTDSSGQVVTETEMVKSLEGVGSVFMKLISVKYGFS